MRLLKQGLADARKGRARKVKEDYTKYVSNDKPLNETNLYLRDPRLRKKRSFFGMTTWPFAPTMEDSMAAQISEAGWR